MMSWAVFLMEVFLMVLLLVTEVKQKGELEKMTREPEREKGHRAVGKTEQHREMQMGKKKEQTEEEVKRSRKKEKKKGEKWGCQHQTSGGPTKQPGEDRLRGAGWTDIAGRR